MRKKHSNKNIYTLKEFEKWLGNKVQQFSYKR